jgi:hypothetical protein
MIKATSIALFLGLAATLAGCELLPKTPWQPEIDFTSTADGNRLISSINKLIGEQQKEFNCLVKISAVKNPAVKNPDVNKSICNDSNNKDLLYKDYMEKLTSEDAKEIAKTIRNGLIDQALPFINSNYANYVNQLYFGLQGFNLGADLIQQAITSSIAVVNPATEATRVLGISLTGFQGARNAFNNNILEKNQTQTLINQMDLNRSITLKIINLCKQAPANEYSIQGAITDLVEYFNSGTLVRSILTLTQDTASNATIARSNLSRSNGNTNSLANITTPDKCPSQVK